MLWILKWCKSTVIYLGLTDEYTSPPKWTLYSLSIWSFRVFSTEFSKCRICCSGMNHRECFKVTHYFVVIRTAFPPLSYRHTWKFITPLNGARSTWTSQHASLILRIISFLWLAWPSNLFTWSIFFLTSGKLIYLRSSVILLLPLFCKWFVCSWHEQYLNATKCQKKIFKVQLVNCRK